MGSAAPDKERLGQQAEGTITKTCIDCEWYFTFAVELEDTACPRCGGILVEALNPDHG